jgi:hypothetical protein
MKTSLLAVAVLVPLFPVPVSLIAQVLEREDNIWGWNHEPTEVWAGRRSCRRAPSRSRTTRDAAADLQTIAGTSRRSCLMRWVLGCFCLTETRHSRLCT